MVFKKFYRKKKFLYRQSRYQSYPLKRMLCNTLIQPHYDFACCSWYLNFKVTKNYVKVTKNYVTDNSDFSQQVLFGAKRQEPYLENNFKKINWLLVSNWVDQCLVLTAYNFKNALSPKYMADIHSLQISPNIWTRRSTDSFVVPFYKKETAGKSISYSGFEIWNDFQPKYKSISQYNRF